MFIGPSPPRLCGGEGGTGEGGIAGSTDRTIVTCTPAPTAHGATYTLPLLGGYPLGIRVLTPRRLSYQHSERLKSSKDLLMDFPSVQHGIGVRS